MHRGGLGLKRIVSPGSVLRFLQERCDQPDLAMRACSRLEHVLKLEKSRRHHHSILGLIKQTTKVMTSASPNHNASFGMIERLSTSGQEVDTNTLSY